MKYLLAIIIVVGLYALTVWGVQHLWNSVVVDAFHTPRLDFWQVLGLLALLSFVGSFFKAESKK